MSGISDGVKIAGYAAAGVAIVFAVALSSCESDIDVQRKPDLANDLVDRSVATCVIQKDPLDEKPYDQRLRDVFMRTYSEALDYIKDNGITVCLDKRLEHQKTGFWGDDAEGIYYPDVKVISLWDNGKDHDQEGLLGWSAASRGYKFLDKFEDTFGGYFDKYASLKDVHTPLFAHHYTVSNGKSSTTYYKWHDSDQRNMGYVLERNPGLAEPPVLAVR